MADDRPDDTVVPSSPPADAEFHDDDELADALAGELAAVTRTEAIAIQRLVPRSAPVEPTPDPTRAAPRAVPVAAAPTAAAPIPRPRGVASGRIDPAGVAVEAPSPDARALDIAPPLPEPIAPQPEPVAPVPPPAAVAKPRRSVIESALRAARRDGIPSLRQSATPPVMVSGPVPARRRSDQPPALEASQPVEPSAAQLASPPQPAREFDDRLDSGPPTVAMTLPEPDPYPGWEQALRAIARPSGDPRPSHAQAPDPVPAPAPAPDPAPISAAAASIAGAAIAGATAGAAATAHADPLAERRGSRRALRARLDTGPVPQPTWALSKEQEADAPEGDLAAFAPLLDDRTTTQPKRMSRRAMRAAERAAEAQAEAGAAATASAEPQQFQDALLGFASEAIAPDAAPFASAPEPTVADEPLEAPTVAFIPHPDEDPPTVVMPATDPAMTVQRVDPPTALLPAAVAAAARGSSAGSFATFGITVGALAAPIALVVGASVGPGPASAVALLAGVVSAGPAIARQASAAVRLGTGTLGVQRAVFGSTGGSVVAVLLFVARVAAGILALLLVGQIGRAIAVHAGVASALASLPGLLLSLGVGALGTAAVLWRQRLTSMLLLVGGVAAVLVTLALFVLLPLRAATTVQADPSGAAVVGFVGVGMLIATGIADLVGGTTASMTGRSTASGAVAGTVVGALVSAAGIIVAVNALIGGLTVAIPAGVVGVAVGVGCAALLGTILRSAGTMLADGVGGPVPIGVLITGLVVIAGTLAVPFTELQFAELVRLWGPILAVPVVAWAGVVSAVPARWGRARLTGAFVAVVVAAVVGLLLLDGVILPGERSGVLDLLGLGVASPLRASCLLALAVTFVAGLAGGGIAAAVRRPARGHVAVADSLQA